MADSPSVTRILRPFFDATYGPLEDGPRYPCPLCGGEYGGNEFTKRGHFVGDLMDWMVVGQPVDENILAWFLKHEAWVPYLEAGRKYLRENPPKEKPVCQLRLYDNLQRVNGKPDWLFVEEGRVVDVKTGSEPPDWLGMQTGEYAVLADIKYNRRFDRREILWLRADGDYRIIPHENPHDAGDFNDLLRAYWVMRERLNGKS